MSTSNGLPADAASGITVKGTITLANGQTREAKAFRHGTAWLISYNTTSATGTALATRKQAATFTAEDAS